MMRLTHVSLPVPDYDEALAYYTEVLGWHKIEDVPFGEGARWVTVSPQVGAPTAITLFVPRAEDADRKAFGLVFGTDDAHALYQQFKAKGVNVQEPRGEGWGVQMLFTDKYGHEHVVVQQPPMPSA